MAEITASMVKELRERTGAGMMDCKNALVEAGGDAAKASELIQKKGLAKAVKAAGRIAADGMSGKGVITSYIHHGARLGVLVEVTSERGDTPEAREFANEIALQIASMGPKYVRKEDAPAAGTAKQREIFSAQMKTEIDEAVA